VRLNISSDSENKRLKFSSVTFSIITVTYNDSKGLRKTFDSVKSQIFQDYEWIIIDGNSKDDTKTFMESITMPNCIWISEKDSGIYDAMNKGINLCNGQYTVFLNAGDTLPSSDTLIKINTFIGEQIHIPDVVMGIATYILPNGLKMHKYPKKVEDYLWHGMPANHQAIYFSKATIKKNLYDPKYKICGDYYIIAKLYMQNMLFSIINEPLVEFAIGGASYYKVGTLWRESYIVKRDILHLRLHLRIKSFIKSVVSTLGLIIVSQTYLNWLGKVILRMKKIS
jgi:putative colanic acid biosynthesis glycosyltransferase